MGSFQPALLARTPPHRLPEGMDDPDCDPDALREALEGLSRAGRWLGGERLLRREVAGLLGEATPGRIRILDVGAGSGAGALRLSRWLCRRGWRPRLVLGDRHAGTLRIARRRTRGEARNRGVVNVGRAGGAEPGSPRLVRLTAPRLPFADGAFDLVVSSTTLHHLERSEARDFLSELARVSTRGWALVDLRRSAVTYTAVRLLGETLWRGSLLNRRDGPVSVRRAFTAAEARALAREAGRDGATVTARPFRLAIRDSGSEGPR